MDKRNTYAKDFNEEYIYNSYFKKYEDISFYANIHLNNNFRRIAQSIVKSNRIFFNFKEKEMNLNSMPVKVNSKLADSHYIHFYKTRMFNQNIIKSFHYFNDELFLINLLIKDLNDYECISLINILRGIILRSTDSKNNHLFRDNQENILLIETKNELSLSCMKSNLSLFTKNFFLLKTAMVV